MSTPDADIVRMRGIHISFPGVKALEDVDFALKRGEIHALLGENGAGKSTLIKILSGAEQSDGGQIWLEDRPYRPHNPRDALRASLSTIYQVFNLLPDRSVMHNILLGKEPRNALNPSPYSANFVAYPATFSSRKRSNERLIVLVSSTILDSVQ